MEEKREPEQDSKVEEKVEENKESEKDKKEEDKKDDKKDDKKEEDDEENTVKTDYVKFWQQNIPGANRLPENPMLEQAFRVGKNFEANFSDTFERHQEKFMNKVTPQIEKLTAVLQEQNPIPNLVQHFLNYALPKGPKPEPPFNVGQASKPQPSKLPEPTGNKSTATDEAPKKPSDEIAKNTA